MIRKTSWVMDKLFQIFTARKGVGHFILCITVKGMETISVVNIKITQRDSFSLRIVEIMDSSWEGNVIKEVRITCTVG